MSHLHLAGVLVDADLDHLRGVGEAHGRADRAAAMLAALGFGRVKVPLTVSVPVSTSAASTTSVKGSALVGAGHARSVSPSHSISSASTSSRLRRRGDQHALERLGGASAALPTMKVTRDE